MQTIETQIATSMTADFEEKTWTFLMPDKFEVRAGKFAIVDKPVYDELMSVWDKLVEWRNQSSTPEFICNEIDELLS